MFTWTWEPWNCDSSGRNEHCVLYFGSSGSLQKIRLSSLYFYIVFYNPLVKWGQFMHIWCNKHHELFFFPSFWLKEQQLRLYINLLLLFIDFLYYKATDKLTDRLYLMLWIAFTQTHIFHSLLGEWNWRFWNVWKRGQRLFCSSPVDHLQRAIETAVLCNKALGCFFY